MKSSIQIAAALFAFACASGAEVYRVNINTLDLDRGDRLVVTNVSFGGLATEVGVESSVRNATADVMVAVSGKQDTLPYPTNSIPYLALTNSPDLSVYAEKDDLSLKQDKLPYQTNAIPYSAIEGTPDMSLKQDSLPYPTNAIPYSAVAGTPDMSLKQDILPYPTNKIPYSVVTDVPDLSIYATVDDLSKKQDCLPYPTNEIPYSAISGKPDMSLKQDELPYPTNAIPYSAVVDTPDLSGYATLEDVGKKQDALPYPTNEIPYSSISGVPDVDFTKATNAANFAISELARTNTVLNGGPYLKEHQSLEPATNYTDYAISRMAETNEVIKNGPYLKYHQSLWPATNYTDNAVMELSRTNSVLSGGPYLKEHQSLEPSTNYTDYAVAELAKTNSVLSNGPYLKEHQSLEPATNYSDYVIIRMSETNEVLKGGPYLKEHQSLEPSTNYANFALGMFSETGTVYSSSQSFTSSNSWNIFDSEGSPRPWSYMSETWSKIALFGTNYTDNAIIDLAKTNSILRGGPYLEKHQSLDPSTNYTNFAVIEFARTNSILNGGPYLTEHQSLYPATNYADHVAIRMAETNEVLSGGPYLKEHQSLQPSTNYTDYAVIRMAETNEVLSGGPYLTEHQSLEPSTNYTDYAVIELARTNSVLANGPYVQSASMTNTVRDVVTNTVTIGYTDWVYSGNTTVGVAYTINVTESGSDYVFTLYNPSEIGSVTTNVLHPTRLDFTGVGIVAECTPIIRNVNGLAMYSDVQALETKIDTMDTSYYRVVGITNKNQSVQFVETDANTTSLQILMPESGMTKDWLVYVKALTNLTLVLPPADYWVVNESVTNEIPPLVPTALYFSQISDNTYSIGRQELIPITVLSQREIENQMIRAKMRKAGLASRNAKRSVTTSKGTAK